jgi:hypothetical protein
VEENMSDEDEGKDLTISETSEYVGDELLEESYMSVADKSYRVSKAMDVLEGLIDEGRDEEAIEYARYLRKKSYATTVMRMRNQVIPCLSSTVTKGAYERYLQVISRKLFPLLIKQMVAKNPRRGIPRHPLMTSSITAWKWP